MIHLDSEQKRVLKVISCSGLGCLVGYPLLMWEIHVNHHTTSQLHYYESQSR
jgi:hypothetical protein